jgi:hypothetical protein
VSHTSPLKLNVAMLSGVMLSVVVLSVIMLSVGMLSVIMLSVVAPFDLKIIVRSFGNANKVR